MTIPKKPVLLLTVGAATVAVLAVIFIPQFNSYFFPNKDISSASLVEGAGALPEAKITQKFAEAVRNLDIAKITSMLSAYPSLINMTIDGDPLLLYAVKNGNMTLIQALVDNGPPGTAARMMALAGRFGNNDLADKICEMAEAKIERNGGIPGTGPLPDKTLVDQFNAALARGDATTIAALLAENPSLVNAMAADKSALANAVAERNSEALQAMITNGPAGTAARLAQLAREAGNPQLADSIEAMAEADIIRRGGVPGLGMLPDKKTCDSFNQKCMEGKLSEAAAMLKKNPSLVNSRKDKQMLLDYIVKHERKDLAQVLIENGPPGTADALKKKAKDKNKKEFSQAVEAMKGPGSKPAKNSENDKANDENKDKEKDKKKSEDSDSGDDDNDKDEKEKAKIGIETRREGPESGGGNEDNKIDTSKSGDGSSGSTGKNNGGSGNNNNQSEGTGNTGEGTENQSGSSKGDDDGEDSDPTIDPNSRKESPEEGGGGTTPDPEDGDDDETGTESTSGDDSSGDDGTADDDGDDADPTIDPDSREETPEEGGGGTVPDPEGDDDDSAGDDSGGDDDSSADDDDGSTTDPEIEPDDDDAGDDDGDDTDPKIDGDDDSSDDDDGDDTDPTIDGDDDDSSGDDDGDDADPTIDGNDDDSDDDDGDDDSPTIGDDDDDGPNISGDDDDGPSTGDDDDGDDDADDDDGDDDDTGDGGEGGGGDYDPIEDEGVEITEYEWPKVTWRHGSSWDQAELSSWPDNRWLSFQTLSKGFILYKNDPDDDNDRVDVKVEKTVDGETYWEKVGQLTLSHDHIRHKEYHDKNSYIPAYNDGWAREQAENMRADFRKEQDKALEEDDEIDDGGESDDGEKAGASAIHEFSISNFRKLDLPLVCLEMWEYVDGQLQSVKYVFWATVYDGYYTCENGCQAQRVYVFTYLPSLKGGETIASTRKYWGKVPNENYFPTKLWNALKTLNDRRPNNVPDKGKDDMPPYAGPRMVDWPGYTPPADSTMVRTTSVGGTGGGEFTDTRGSDRHLIGFNVWYGDFWGATGIRGIQPIFREPDGSEKTGNLHGDLTGSASQIKAADGYAVGGLIARGDSLVRGFRAIYMKINGSKLKPSMKYNSTWIGGYTGEEKQIGGDGKRCIGIFGRSGSALDQLGLLQNRD